MLNSELQLDKAETLLAHLPVPRWWTCKIHGDALPHNAWGCPECGRELREEVRKLRAFAQGVMEAWPLGDVDGGDLQDLAFQHETAALAAERERCAQACEDEARLWERDGKGPATEARLCAARVRALGPNVGGEA